MRYLTYKATDPQNLTKCFYYKIADSIYCSNKEIPEIKYLIQSQKNFSEEETLLTSQVKTNQQIYNKVTKVGESQYRLRVYTNIICDYRLIANQQNYTIKKNKILIDAKKNDPIILFGPAIILNLAINNIYCLHASACLINKKIFIIMADSGTGKSTIARFIDKQANAKRIADDIVPVMLKNDKLTLLPNFPQLKLVDDNQYTGEDICLEPSLIFVKKDSKNVIIKKVNHLESIKNLIKHTVATRLFNNFQLKNHLDFCYKISNQVKSYQVKYSHTPDSLPTLFKLLNEHC